MDIIFLLIIGAVTGLNLMFVKMKFDRKRYEDGVLDLLVLVALSFVFGGSFSGLVVATVSSLIISIYLFISPPKLLTKLLNSH